MTNQMTKKEAYDEIAYILRNLCVGDEEEIRILDSTYPEPLNFIIETLCRMNLWYSANTVYIHYLFEQDDLWLNRFEAEEHIKTWWVEWTDEYKEDTGEDHEPDVELKDMLELFEAILLCGG